MAKNEAKVKFTAEVGGFNDSISKANSELSKLRAEAKLNATQMKATGTTVEGLENKHKNLQSQLDASESKTEALNQKINSAIKYFGEDSIEVSKLRTQLANAQTAEEKLRQAVSACETELEQHKNATEDAGNAIESMSDKVKRQENELSDLKRAYADIVAESGEASDEAQTLAREISDLSSDLKQNKDALEQASNKADELDRSLDNAGDSAQGAGDGFTVMKGVVADLASEAIQMAIGKISEFIGYLAELPEATRELRQDLSTLTTSFDNMGFSTKEAESTWKDLYAVFGEDDRAVETANNISKMAKDQEDLSDWVTITTGVWGAYQDSLPVEGLAEASNETAKTGKVTGVLADALNWSSEASKMFAKYIGEGETAEDGFNKALEECTNEQERQKLITDTLKSLYGESAETYRDTASAQMEAKEATAENMLAEADLAESLEPVTTAFTDLKTTLLESFAPAIETVSGLMLDALDWAKEHPVAIQVLAGVLGTLALAFTGLAVGLGIYSVAQWIANGALAGFMTPILAVIAIIAVVVGVIIVLVNYWDEIVLAVQRCWESVKATLATWGEWISTNVIQPVKQFFSDLWNGIKETASGLWDGIKTVFSEFVSWIDSNVVQPVINFFTGMWQGIKTAWDTICNVVQVAIMLIGEIIATAFEIITLPFRFIWENCKGIIIDAWNGIKNAVSTAIDAVKNTIVNVWNAIVAFITPILNTIKSTITTAWNAVKSVISNVLSAIKNTVSNVWNAIKTAISTVINAIKTTVSNVWNAIKSVTSNVFNSVKSTASSVWESIKSAISNVVNGIKSTVSNVWDGIKSTTSNVFNGIKSTASNVWNSIKTAIMNPINSARDAVKSAIDKMKSFFNFSWSLPRIKLPHFSISGKFSLNPPSIPRFSVSWYKEGGIMMNPTIFGINGNSLMAGGEAGPEAILPIDKLEGYVVNAIERTVQVPNLNDLVSAVEDLANRAIELKVNGREIAVATASDSDNVNGLRSTFRSRGLVLD